MNMEIQKLLRDRERLCKKIDAKIARIQKSCDHDFRVKIISDWDGRGFKTMQIFTKLERCENCGLEIVEQQEGNANRPPKWEHHLK